MDVVNIYGPTAWHGFRPTDDELMSYYDEVFAEVRHPTALAPNPIIGYTPARGSSPRSAPSIIRSSQSTWQA